MKKQIIILLLLIVYASSQAQKGFIKKTSAPCDQAMIDAFPGKWVNHEDMQAAFNRKVYTGDVQNRFIALNNLCLEVYPSPAGADAGWIAAFSTTSFADHVKYEMNQNRMLNEEKVKTNPVSRYRYDLFLYPYYCDRQNEIWNARLNERGSESITLDANYLSILTGDVETEEGWTIEGLPVKYKMQITGKWKGYDVYGGSSVLITRNGMLPYIPVTRKQLFDRIIPYATKFFDQKIKDMAAAPVRTLAEQEAEKNKVLEDYKKTYGSDAKKLKSAVDYYLSGYQTDQQRRDDELKIMVKKKQDELKKFNDELEKTTKEGLLDAPAIVPPGDLVLNPLPVFSTEAEGGSMLVTENPNYFRKDLSKNVPQFFVLSWVWEDLPRALKFRKAFEENFPIEKLQAMIDK